MLFIKRAGTLFMSELLFSLDVIIPLFLCCLVGYLMRRWKYVGDVFAEECSNVVFYIAIPCNIFTSILESDFRTEFNGNLVAFVIIASSIIAFLSIFTCKKVIPDARIAATVAHDIFRGNFTLLGIPLATSLLGSEGAVSMMLVVPFGILCSNTYSVLIFTTVNPSKNMKSSSIVWKSVQKVFTNPMTIASILGILISFFQISLPSIIISPINSFSKMSGGLALFMLGTQLQVSGLLKNLRYTAVTVTFRLIIIPIITIFVAVALGFSGNALVVLMIFFASPTAVTCYILAGTMDGDKELAITAVLTTSCLSTVTLTLGIFLLKALQLI